MGSKAGIPAGDRTWLPPADKVGSRVAYSYSSYLDLNDPALLRRLGEAQGRGLVVTASGTASIATVLTFLKHAGVASMRVLTPAYFAIEALCENLNIDVSYAAIERADRRYVLPEGLCDNPTDAVWLTSPIFGTSCYLDPKGVGAFIDSLPPDVIVVVDESLAFIDRSSLASTRTLDRVVRIVTPNKAICVNGEKASFISAPRHSQDGLNDWSECLAGGIGASGLQALKFFRSAAFDEATAMARHLQARQKARMMQVLDGLSSYSADDGTDGHFVMLYWPNLPVSALERREDLLRMMTTTGAVVIPSTRNRHPPQYGYSFRINLMRLDNAGLGALRRLSSYLEPFG